MGARVAVVVALLFGHLGVRAADPWSAGPPATPRDPQTWNFAGRGTGGFVRSVGKDDITLFRPEMSVQRFRHDPLTGLLLEAHKPQYHAEWPDKKFLLVEELADGNYIQGASAERTYRITDVNVGDWVEIDYCRRNGVDICKTISIHRRPGGRVPPAPGEKADEFRKYHEQANADQEWEEKRVAYPERYRPSYRGDDGKTRFSPYPSDSLLITPKKPTAPSPREVKP